MRKNAVLSLALVFALLCGCASTAQTPPPDVESPPPAVETSQPIVEQRIEWVEVEQVTPNALAAALLEHECAQAPEGNVILSPLSIQMALSMAANGAPGEARDALTALLGADVESLNALLGAWLEKGDATLTLANSMWFDRELEPLVDGGFQDALSRVYQAREGYFTPYSQDSAREINAWVKEATRGKIEGILTADALTPVTLAVLVNALYFDGRWVDPFEDWQVAPGTFAAQGGEQRAEFMSQRLGTYFETDYACGFSKAYEEGYEFIGILPREEGPVELSRLDLDAFLATETWEYDVDVKLPKFELEYQNSLVDTLTQLGLGSLFGDGSLNGMLTPDAVADGNTAYVGDVIHKTYMKMDEKGTEAAAVTAVMVECGSAMPVEREVRQVWLDRPFAFVIRESRSGQIVFCGVVNTLE